MMFSVNHELQQSTGTLPPEPDRSFETAKLDPFVPLDSHAKQFARERFVSTFEDRIEKVYCPLVDICKDRLKAKKSVHMPATVYYTDYPKNTKALVININDDISLTDIAIKCVKYRRMGEPMVCFPGGQRVRQVRWCNPNRRGCRKLYMICTGWGIIPAGWRTLTGAYVALMAVSVTSLLAQAPTQAANLANEKETVVDVEDWIIYFLQIMTFSLVLYVIVYVINLSTVCFRPAVLNLRRATFMSSLRQYANLDDNMANWDLEYDSDQDPGVGMIFFTTREAHENEVEYESAAHPSTSSWLKKSAKVANAKNQGEKAEKPDEKTVKRKPWRIALEVDDFIEKWKKYYTDFAKA